MISVAEALDHLFALVAPMPTERVPLRAAACRVLAHDVRARRSQPPFDASAMDGYALRGAEAEQDAQFKVIGEAAAGHGFAGSVGPGQCVRIFTGAPMPTGADHVVIQEDVIRRGDLISLTSSDETASHVRPAGGDFKAGDSLTAPRLLCSADIALLAAMNIAEVPVHKRPIVAILATGDELVAPGDTPGPGQIVASNSYGLAAQLEAAGAEARLLPIARDTEQSLAAAFDLAAGADLIVTIGGASVGDRDLVARAAAAFGMEQAFYKVAMRPGKPLMAGRLRGVPMIGLPGNPVSALVCGTVFVVPVVHAMLGLGRTAAPLQSAPLAAPLAANGPRAHYMRAKLGEDGLRVFERQDSSLLSVLADADALLVRAPNDPARTAGDIMEYIRC